MNNTFVIAWRSKARLCLTPDEKPEEAEILSEDSIDLTETEFPQIADIGEREAVLI